MKRIVTAGVICLAASAAWADGPGEPLIEPEIIVEETAASSGGDDWVVLFMVAITFGTALMN